MNHSIDEIIFENRNKDYGAYELRRNQEKNSLIGFLIGAALISLMFGVPKILDYLTNKNDDSLKIEARKTLKYSELSAPPPIEVDRPPEPVKVKKEPQKAVKYLPPVAKPDEEVLEEEFIPTQDELADAQSGLANVEGPDTIVYDEPGEIVEEPEEVMEPFTIVEEMPKFPGGDKALLSYLSNKIVYPRMALELEVEGRVYISFVINTDGSVTQADVIRGIGSGCDEEALRVVKSMPDWQPGMQAGHKVPVKYVLPIMFEIRE